MSNTPANADTQVLQCSEVWGGNDSVDRAVTMMGLDAWVLSRPHAGDDQGGDIHYLSSCATGRIARLLLADVSGHGQVVADLARRLRDLMRRYMNYVDQGKLVAGLNSEFVQQASAGRFATALIATFWAPTDELDITNAGHPTPLIFRAASQTWQFLESSTSRPADAAHAENIPLGIIDQSTYSHQRIRLYPGDLVLFYTDALIEARAEGKPLLSAHGLLHLLNQLDPAAPGQLLPALLDAVREYADGRLDDDATLLLLRTNDLKPRPSLLAGLITSARLAKQLFRSLLPGGERFARPELSITNLVGAFFNFANK
jgi:serine phosphatase RsbU (regulator of sigma subunit)